MLPPVPLVCHRRDCMRHLRSTLGRRPMWPRPGRTLLIAAAVFSTITLPSLAADHRDAPTIDDYSAIDINDVYMFRNPTNCTPGPECKLVMVLSTQAVADPSFGPS